MLILVVTKLLFDNYMLFMPIYHIKKVPSKNIIFWTFCRHNKNKIRFYVHIWAYLYYPQLCHFCPIRIFLYRNAQEMIIYKIGYFWVDGVYK